MSFLSVSKAAWPRPPYRKSPQVAGRKDTARILPCCVAAAAMLEQCSTRDSRAAAVALPWSAVKTFVRMAFVYYLTISFWSPKQIRLTKQIEGKKLNALKVKLECGPKASTHDIVNALLDQWQWDATHMYEFTLGGRKFMGATFKSSPPPPLLSTFDPHPGDKFEVHYDFGDDWRWFGVVDAVEPVANRVRVISKPLPAADLPPQYDPGEEEEEASEEGDDDLKEYDESDDTDSTGNGDSGDDSEAPSSDEESESDASDAANHGAGTDKDAAESDSSDNESPRAVRPAPAHGAGDKRSRSAPASKAAAAPASKRRRS